MQQQISHLLNVDSLHLKLLVGDKRSMQICILSN